MLMYVHWQVLLGPVRAAVRFLSAEMALSRNLHMHCCKKSWSACVAYRLYLKSDMQPTQHQSFDMSFEVSVHCILLQVLQTQFSDCRYRKLPFEANLSCWNAIPEANARSLIQSLLRPKPQERATASALLTSPMLARMELLSTQ